MSTEIHKFTYRIDDITASISDRTPTPGQLLAEAGFEPADDYVLFARTEHGTRVTLFDESLDLSSGDAEFFASSSGRQFEVRINDHPIFWGSETIEIALLRKLGHVLDDQDLVWMRVFPGNEILPREGAFALNADGIEHLRTHKRESNPCTYRYFVDGIEFTTEHAELTGAQITARLPDWSAENSLVLEGQCADADVVVHPTTVVVFENRATEAHFTVVPPATFGVA